jgi:hypothetical protein
LKLTREQRAAIFAGHPPSITGNGPSPFEAGKTYRISSLVSLKINAVRRRRQGGWKLEYEILDRRDPVKNMRRTPPVVQDEEIRKGFDSYGYPAEPTADVVAQAARESAYTSQPTSLSDAGESVDDKTQHGFSTEAASRDGLREQHRRERWDLGQRLQRAEAEAELLGLDVSHHRRAIAERIARMERLNKGKAA